MRSRTIGLGIMTGLALTACGKSSKKSQGEAAAVGPQFLQLADVTPSAIAPLDKGAMLSDLAGVSDFYDNEPETARTGEGTGDGTNQDAQKCADDILKNSKITAKGDTMSFAIQGDFAPCFSAMMKNAAGEEAKGFAFNITKASFRIGATIQCDGADLGSYDGKNLTEVTKDAKALDQVCEASGKTHHHFNSQTQMAGNVTLFGMSSAFDSVTNALEAKEDGSPCETTKTPEGDHVLGDGCTSWQLTKHIADTQDGKPSDKQGKEDLVKVTWKGRKAKAGDKATWYAAGSADVTINDWTGTVTYKNESEAPDYAMKKGEETATGKIAVKTTFAIVREQAFAALRAYSPERLKARWAPQAR